MKAEKEGAKEIVKEDTEIKDTPTTPGKAGDEASVTPLVTKTQIPLRRMKAPAGHPPVVKTEIYNTLS